MPPELRQRNQALNNNRKIWSHAVHWDWIWKREVCTLWVGLKKNMYTLESYLYTVYCIVHILHIIYIHIDFRFWYILVQCFCGYPFNFSRRVFPSFRRMLVGLVTTCTACPGWSAGQQLNSGGPHPVEGLMVGRWVWQCYVSGGNSNIGVDRKKWLNWFLIFVVYFHLYLGEMIQFDDCAYFSKGLVETTN